MTKTGKKGADLVGGFWNPTFWKNSYVNIRHDDIVKMTQFFILESKKKKY